MSVPILKVRDLGVTFRTGDRTTIASTEVNFELAAGEVLAVVGESGSGKSVSALALTRLLPPSPSCEINGSIKLNGRELVGLTEGQLSKVRGREIAYIFQEPGTSLNPVYTIGFQIGKPSNSIGPKSPTEGRPCWQPFGMSISMTRPGSPTVTHTNFPAACSNVR